jgi:uncharacterized small protein (DUF1192 family)
MTTYDDFMDEIYTLNIRYDTLKEEYDERLAVLEAEMDRLQKELSSKEKNAGI